MYPRNRPLSVPFTSQRRAFTSSAQQPFATQHDLSWTEDLITHDVTEVTKSLRPMYSMYLLLDENRFRPPVRSLRVFSRRFSPLIQCLPIARDTLYRYFATRACRGGGLLFVISQMKNEAKCETGVTHIPRMAGTVFWPGVRVWEVSYPLALWCGDLRASCCATALVFYRIAFSLSYALCSFHAVLLF
jgi:hypothetical protein